MAGGIVEYQNYPVLGVGLAQVLQVSSKALLIDIRKIGAHALSSIRVHGGVEAAPLVAPINDVGWAVAFRTVTPLVPVDKPKASLIEGQNLQRFQRFARLPAVLGVLTSGFYCLDAPGKLFLKASCSEASAC